jgi:hypothetical protein
MRLRIPSWPNLFWYLKYDLRFRLPLNKKTAAELREESIKKKKHKLNQSIQYLILFN